MTFRDLGLIAPILNALDEQGYKQPSPIQSKAIPPALVGRDVLGCAQTGTGKTCAFAAPILQRLNAKKAEGRPIRSLILTPTRELAIQIGESFDAYGRYLPLRTAVIFGGVGQAPQVEKLKKGVDILVATPGRLGDLYQQKLLDLSKIEIFVLDEADRMLDMGFIHDVKKILKWLPEKKQTLFFSATMPPEIIRLVDSLLHDPARVAVDPISSPVEVIRQSVYFVDRGNKTRLLAALVNELDTRSALVFTRTKHGANKVARDLEKSGIPAAAIHGNKSQTARQQALADFKAGRIRCLVATDIAARGLDIEDLSHVFNYNLPDVPETYVHRIGRTGRAGKGGVAVALCDFSEKLLLRDIEKLIGKNIPVIEQHPFPMENFEAPAKDRHGKIINAEDAEARQAARERSRQRQQAAAQIGPEPVQSKAPDPARTEQDAVPGKKKRRRKKKSNSQPTTAAAPAPSFDYEPEPEPAALRPVRPKLTRPGSRFDTGDQMPVVDFDRPDPLAGYHIMDATARLLSPRKIAVPTPPVKKEEPVMQEKRTDRKKKKTPAPQPEKQSAQREETVKRRPKPEQKSGEKQPNKPHQDSAPRSGAKRSRPPRERAPQLPERSGRAKDSTEQKSLMKPYYISHDD